MGDIFASKEVVDKLQKRQDVFESIETMDTITNVFFPKMEKFIKKIDTYNEDHELMREVLRRYDETISHKATRFEMRQMEIKLTESFITQNLWDKMQRDYEKLKEDFSNTKLEYEESLTQFKIQESD